MISLLSYISNFFEKCIIVKVRSFFKKFQVFSSSQYGLLKRVNTADAISDLTEYLSQALNDIECALSIFVVLRKAFDTVNHDVFLCELECYGVRSFGLELLN